MNNKRVPTIDGLAIDKAHKGGNPIKKITKTVKKAAGQTVEAVKKPVSQIKAEAKKIDPKSIWGAAQAATKDLTDIEWYNKLGTVTTATLTNPGAWLAAIPTAGLGFLAAGDKAWQEMSDAERAETRAATDKEMALRGERDATLEQEKMISDKAKADAASAKERATRIGKGRRGLLFQGKESGVTGLSNTLGG